MKYSYLLRYIINQSEFSHSHVSTERYRELVSGGPILYFMGARLMLVTPHHRGESLEDLADRRGKAVIKLL